MKLGRLYVIVDAEVAGRRPLEEVTGEVLAGGAEVIQLRAKTWPARRLLEVGRNMLELCRRRGVPFLVNDRADIARALGADGVHLGQDDLPLEAARRLLGPGRIIGLSVDTLEEALAAEAAGADYVSLGPIFPTATKPDAGPVVGLEGLARVRAGVSLPLVAIGGINADNAARVLAAGADTVAVIGAVVGADNVREATAALRSVLTQGGESA
ncbi:MAG: thiamine phosphate synthase [Clostridia bacterium]|jgi:thiamine-phosphate diphosphorylase|nr:thiamine phosphate synthase [Clostridia bacterium]MDH7572067.1 thiamine phosphate synthase [Clostridia bacterium]